jgi:hypothetical protein
MNLKQSDYAEEKYCTDSVTTGEARLLCRLSIGRIGAQTHEATSEQGDARMPRHIGGTDWSRHSGEGEQPRYESPIEAAM